MLSFDDFPVVYFALGYLLAAAVALLVYGNKIRIQELLFLVASGTLVILMRLPIVIFNQEINPDESQMIAHALTLQQYPIYWQSVDGTTIGPLDNYVLLLPSFFGIAINYTSAKLVGLLCVLGSLWFFYKSVKNFFNGSVARLALLPPLFLVTFTQDADFVHYSSEQLPVFLLNWGLWLLSNLIPSPSARAAPSIWRREQASLRPDYKSRRALALSGLFWLGFVLGMSPFAKIQVVPQAAVIGLFSLVFTFQPKNFFRNAGALIAGGITFPLLIIGWAAAYGVLDDFWDFYVLGNLIYAGGSSVLDSILRIPSFFAKSPDFIVFLISIGLSSLLAFFVPKKLLDNQSKTPLTIIFFACFWLVASLYAATKSGNDFVHYLNLCIYPFGLIGAFFINKNFKNQQFSSLTALLILLPFTSVFGYKILKHQPLITYMSTADHRVPVSNVSKLILQHATSKDRLVVWGWMCRYHIETQMPQGTAENHSERCIYPHPMREKYYQRYLSDLEQNRPKVFVDAIPNSLWLNDRATQAHEAFPKLNEFITKNYHLVGEVERTRVYVRNAEQ
ncbi:hypothetical protein [Runella sp.]|uniref:hypothetical protein n=1 Tax=Runella sp. TaxID=1960881 RepID=UPI00301AE461